MNVALMSPETATVLSQVSVALLGVAAVVAAFVVTAVALSTALYIHRSRAAIARHRFGEIDVRKPR
ncbi:hypothetical protein [Pleomorphomonas koreensis]|uniref:hypothetical protein n=1 Tax=Pleomorphomonas koreensis TaxID=257440 RepID=UPI00040D578D|nr:hypothetical protein [Pleomorphomonas koreensis]